MDAVSVDLGDDSGKVQAPTTVAEKKEHGAVARHSSTSWNDVK